MYMYVYHFHTHTCVHTHTHTTHTRTRTHTHTRTHTQVVWYYPGIHAQTKLDSYTISYRRPDQSIPIAEYDQSISKVTSYIISASETAPVKPYTTYVVTVWANYKSGERVGSENVTVRTSEDVPGAPEEVAGTVVNASIVLVEWKVAIRGLNA